MRRIGTKWRGAIALCAALAALAGGLAALLDQATNPEPKTPSIASACFAVAAVLGYGYHRFASRARLRWMADRVAEREMAEHQHYAGAEAR
jgi:hypothetical protein